MARSQNGWTVNPPRRSRLVPHTSDVRVTVADGPAGEVLLHVLGQVHTRVESLELDGARGALDDWGYAERPIRGGTETSNHASATAVDGNATRHALGVRNTFSPKQVAEIHQILREVDNVVRWGGDYDGRVDEMHFEINDDHAAVKRVADRLARHRQTKEEDMQQTEKLKDAGPGSISHNLLNTNQVLNNRAFGLAALGARIRALTAAVAADKDLDPAAVARVLDEAVAANMPTAAEVAAAQREFLEDLVDEVVREVVREVVPDEQADRIIDALAEKLSATTERTD